MSAFAFPCSRCKMQLDGDTTKTGQTVTCRNSNCKTENQIPELVVTPSKIERLQTLSLGDQLQHHLTKCKAATGPTPQEKVYADALVFLLTLMQNELPDEEQRPAIAEQPAKPIARMNLLELQAECTKRGIPFIVENSRKELITLLS